MLIAFFGIERFAVRAAPRLVDVWSLTVAIFAVFFLIFFLDLSEGVCRRGLFVCTCRCRLVVPFISWSWACCCVTDCYLSTKSCIVQELDCYRYTYLLPDVCDAALHLNYPLVSLAGTLLWNFGRRISWRSLAVWSSFNCRFAAD